MVNGVRSRSPTRASASGSSVTTSSRRRQVTAARSRYSARTVFASGPAIAGTVLDRFAHAPHTLLDGLGDDLVAVGADEAAGTLTLAAGAGNHRLFTAEIDGGVLVASQLCAARGRARP